jgi:GGDEF domain-containing protein
VDEATGAAVRKYGELRVGQALEALNAFDIPFGWLRIGLDKAEILERGFGHGIIDAAMKTVAHTVDGNLGPLDVLTRWDSTEFRVEVHYSSRFELAEMTEKLVTLIRASNLDWWGDRRRFTASIAGGAAQRGDTLASLETRVAGVFESCRAGGGNCAAVFSGIERR